MRNKSILIIPLLILLFIPFLLASDYNYYWGNNGTGDGSIINGISTTSYPFANIFYKDSSWYALIQSGDVAPTSYSWNGTKWLTNGSVTTAGSIIYGLADVGTNMQFNVFQMGNDWYTIVGENAAWYGYAWNGTKWLANSTIINGLSYLSGNSRSSTVFNINNDWYLVSGNITSTSGYLRGHVWNGTGWQANSTISNGIGTSINIGSGIEVTSGYIGSQFYLLTGSASSNHGFAWDGTQWVEDSFIVNGLRTSGGRKLMLTPFYMDNSYYLILAEWGSPYLTAYSYLLDILSPIYSSISVNTTEANATARFGLNVSDNGYISPVGTYIFSTNNSGVWENDTAVNFTNTPDWANVTKMLNETIGTVVGYRWYISDDAGNTNSTPINILTTTEPSITYFGVSVNNNASGMLAKFDITVTSPYSLQPYGTYIFSTNNSGVWENDTAVLFNTNPSSVETIKTLNPTAGTLVGYMWYFNNSYGTKSSTEIYTLNTTQIVEGTFTGFSFNTNSTGNGNDNPSGIYSNGTFIWVTDGTDDEVYIYNMDGTYTGNHWDTAGSGSTNAKGMAFDGTYFWIWDTSTGYAYKFFTNGTYANFKFARGHTEDNGIAWDGVYFWIGRLALYTVYNYFPNGTYGGLSFNFGTITGNLNRNMAGLVSDGTFIWDTDYADDSVYKFYLNGTYAGIWLTGIYGNNDPAGITQNGTYFWIMDATNDNVYQYILNYTAGGGEEPPAFSWTNTSIGETLSMGDSGNKNNAFSRLLSLNLDMLDIILSLGQGNPVINIFQGIDVSIVINSFDSLFKTSNQEIAITELMTKVKEVSIIPTQSLTVYNIINLFNDFFRGINEQVTFSSPGSNYWVVNTTINNSLPDIGSNSKPAVFQIGNDWYMISGALRNMAGFAWDGTQWLPNDTINASLPTYGVDDNLAPTIFYKDTSWYMISGEKFGRFYGYVWTGTQWIVNTTINNSLPTFSRGYTNPTVFQKDGTWYLITGGLDGGYNGFSWDGTQWVTDITITSPLTNYGNFSSPTVFQKDGTWYMISNNLNEGYFLGFAWDGAGWSPNLEINDSLPHGNFYNTPDVFYKDSSWYLLSGRQDGKFYGYTALGNPPIVSELLTTQRNVPVEINEEISSIDLLNFASILNFVTNIFQEINLFNTPTSANKFFKSLIQMITQSDIIQKLLDLFKSSNQEIQFCQYPFNTTGLVGWWTMDNYNSTGILDNTQNNLVGIFNGGLGESSIINGGKLDKALQYNGWGSGNFINLSKSINGKLGQQGAISYWIYFNESNMNIGGGNEYRVIYWNNANAQIYGVYEEDGRLRWRIYKSNGVEAYSDLISSYWKNYTWMNYIFQYNGDTGLYQIYLNGELVKDYNMSIFSVRQSTGDTCIGGFCGGNNVLNGSMDEIMLFNRTLSQSEITQIYNLQSNQRECSNIPQLGFSRASTQEIQVCSYPFDTTGLVSWWKMDENSTNQIDSWGNSTGITYGSTFTDSGKFNGAYQFDGNDYIDYGNDSSLNIPYNFSISVWVYPTGTILPESMIATRADTTGSGTNWRFMAKVYLSNTGINWGFRVDPTVSESVANSQLFVNNWYHLVVTYNGTTVNFYKNGVPDGSAAETIRLGVDYPLKVARGIGGAQRYFNGTIDEVMIFNKTLSPTEVENIYNLQSNQRECSVVPQSSLIRNPTNELTFNEAVTKFGNFFKKIYQEITESDLVTKFGNFFKNLYQLVSESDMIKAFNNLFKNTNQEIQFCSYPFNTTGLAGWWTMDNYNSTGVFDSSGNNNFGSFTGTNFGISNLTTGKIGDGLSLDGNNNYINIVDNNRLNITGDLTISLWIDVNKFPNAGAAYQFAISHGNPGETEDVNSLYSLAFWDTTRLGYFHENGSGTDNNIGTERTNMQTNKWYYITITRDTTTKTIKFYINGTLFNSYYLGVSSYIAQPTGGNAGNLQIGRSSTTSDSYLNASIDEVMIFNRTLSQSEITQIYNLQSNQRECSNYQQQGFSRASNQNITYTDLVTNLNRFFRFGNQQITETDAVSRLNAFLRISTGNIDLSNIIISLRNIFTTSNQQITKGDAINSFLGLFRNAGQNISSNDLTTSFRNFFKYPNQEITEEDIALYFRGVNVGIFDSITPSDIVFSLRAFIRNPNQEIIFYPGVSSLTKLKLTIINIFEGIDLRDIFSLISPGGTHLGGGGGSSLINITNENNTISILQPNCSWQYFKETKFVDIPFSHIINCVVTPLSVFGGSILLEAHPLLGLVALFILLVILFFLIRRYKKKKKEKIKMNYVPIKDDKKTERFK